jgi:hypothetical protein
MNERFNQLITEADTHAWSIADKYVTRDCCHDGEVNYLWEDAFREKFAELIVKECANHIAGQLPDERLDDWHEGYHAGVQRSIDCLKDFGVK